jgi:hypothetical protein
MWPSFVPTDVLISLRPVPGSRFISSVSVQLHETHTTSISARPSAATSARCSVDVCGLLPAYLISGNSACRNEVNVETGEEQSRERLFLYVNYRNVPSRMLVKNAERGDLAEQCYWFFEYETRVCDFRKDHRIQRLSVLRKIS